MSRPAALVTGASRGIGRAVALELAKLEYRVIVNYVNSAEAAEGVVEEIAAAGGEAEAVQADVGRSEDRDRLLEETLRDGAALEVLVNNAGITSVGRKDLLEANEASWDRVFDTNLKGPFFLTQQAARSMIEQRRAGSLERATIVNVSSISGIAVSTNRADYCLTKSAMEMMTWLFATRLADDGIFVFEVCPGIIASDMTQPVREKYDTLIAEGLTPIRRWGRPEDVARAVGGLVSGTLPFCTGQRICIDGGFHIRQL